MQRLSGPRLAGAERDGRLLQLRLELAVAKVVCSALCAKPRAAEGGPQSPCKYVRQHWIIFPLCTFPAPNEHTQHPSPPSTATCVLRRGCPVPPRSAILCALRSGTPQSAPPACLNLRHHPSAPTIQGRNHGCQRCGGPTGLCACPCSARHHAEQRRPHSERPGSRVSRAVPEVGQ